MRFFPTTFLETAVYDACKWQVEITSFVFTFLSQGFLRVEVYNYNFAAILNEFFAVTQVRNKITRVKEGWFAYDCWSYFSLFVFAERAESILMFRLSEYKQAMR